MKRNITFNMVKTQVSTLYKQEKRRQEWKSLTSDQFKKLVLGVFKHFNLTISEGNDYERWFKVIMTTFGSKGGVKNASQLKTQKNKKEIRYEQTEFKLSP